MILRADIVLVLVCDSIVPLNPLPFHCCGFMFVNQILDLVSFLPVFVCVVGRGLRRQFVSIMCFPIVRPICCNMDPPTVQAESRRLIGNAYCVVLGATLPQRLN